MPEVRPDWKPASTAGGIGRRRLRRFTDWTALRSAKGGPCRLCGEPRYQLHHLLSRARGGPNAAWNLAPLCQPCHGRITREDAAAKHALAGSLKVTDGGPPQATPGGHGSAVSSGTDANEERDTWDDAVHIAAPWERRVSLCGQWNVRNLAEPSYRPNGMEGCWSCLQAAAWLDTPRGATEAGNRPSQDSELVAVVALPQGEPDALPDLDELGPVLCQVLDEDEAMAAFQVLGQAGYLIVRAGVQAGRPPGTPNEDSTALGIEEQWGDAAGAASSGTPRQGEPQ